MAQLNTPYFLVDEGLLRKNLEILRQVQQEAGCKILLAQKAFSMFACYPLISRYLAGTTASGLYEEMMEKTGRTPRLPEAVDTDVAPEALPE